MASADQEKVAVHFGFPSFAELLDASQKLPLIGDEKRQSYVARHPSGFWFVWDDPESVNGQPRGD